MGLFVFQISCVLLAVSLVVRVNSQGTIRNPSFFNTVEKSIRGFYFKKYYDFISGAYTPAALDRDGKKTIQLKGNRISWTLDLKINKFLFSPKYKYYDAQYQPQESNLRNCHYHGRVLEYPNSFLALSDCEGLHGMVVLDDVYRFSIHTLEQNRGIVIVRENSIMDKFGFYEKTTANPPNAERVFNVREKRKADPVPDVKKEPKVTVEEEYKNNNVQDKEKHDLKVPMHPTIPEPTSPVINKDTETVTLANIKNTKNKNEKIGSRGPLKKDEPNTFTQTNVDSTKKREEKPKIPVPPKTRPPLPNIKSPEQLSREAILKERKRVAKAMWGSGRKIDFEKLGLGLNELNPSTSREQTRGDSINLKKRQVSYEKYYDITLTLGYIEEIKNPRHAEQYLADVMNLLQCYYERFNFKGYSARLSGSHYLLHHDTLVKFQGLPKIPENKVGYYFGKWLNYKKPFQTADQNFLLSLKPKSLQSTFTSNGHTTINTGCWKMSASGVAFIREDSITNAYELITTLAHEIAHGTGMDHANTPGCFGNGQTMLEPNRPYFKLWMPFAQCTLNQMVCTPSSYR